MSDAQYSMISPIFTILKNKNYLQIHGDSKNEAINLLTRVTGIGPAKAHSLVKEGITSLEELNKNTDKLTHHQIIGLKCV